MEFKFNLTGADRKKLVTVVSELLEKKPNYKGAPTFAYEFDGVVIDKNGTLCIDDCTDSEVVDSLLAGLETRGFSFETADRLVIELPRAGLSDAALENLRKLIESKAGLIKKALGTEDLHFDVNEDKVSFPWFAFEATPQEVNAYARFIGALCALAKTIHRVNATAKAVENEKYAFRCFLLRLGFIGVDYKQERKLLLSKLSGNAAFRDGRPELIEDAGEVEEE